MSQRKQPGNTFAWLFLIAFVPYVGVPLYLMFGGRKLRRLAALKAPLSSTPTVAPFDTLEQTLASREAAGIALIVVGIILLLNA